MKKLLVILYTFFFGTKILKFSVNPVKFYVYSTPQFRLGHFKCSVAHVASGYYLEQHRFRVYAILLT